MSLDFNYQDVANPARWGDTKDSTELTTDEKWERDKVQYFCYLLMSIDMGTVTEANLLEVQVRAHLFQTSVGGVISFSTGDNYIYSSSEIKSYIGYSTNVSTKTRAQWLKRLGMLVEERLGR